MIHGVVAYPSIPDVPGDVDVAFIAVPATEVEAQQCGRKGIRGLVIVSAEFEELGGEGSKRQTKLLEICRSFGIRLIGPNCMGIVNTAEDVAIEWHLRDRVSTGSTDRLPVAFWCARTGG